MPTKKMEYSKRFSSFLHNISFFERNFVLKISAFQKKTILFGGGSSIHGQGSMKFEQVLFQLLTSPWAKRYKNYNHLNKNLAVGRIFFQKKQFLFFGPKNWGIFHHSFYVTKFKKLIIINLKTILEQGFFYWRIFAKSLPEKYDFDL
jgi:hypothetical protein